MILYERLIGFNPYSSATNIHELQSILSQRQIEIPPPSVPNTDATPECLELLQRRLEVSPNKRMGWRELFQNKWANYYSCKTTSQDYEKELYATSIGSLIENSPVNDYYNE